MHRADIEEFRDGIFALRTRRFGTVAEIMIKKLYDFDESDSIFFDKRDSMSGNRIEVKFSTVMRKNSNRINDYNVVEQCYEANTSSRMVNAADAHSCKFDCNIEQVKSKEFDVLYYGLFFADQIEIYKMNSDEVMEQKGYSNKQHKGNVGEGQFHLNERTIDYHRQNFLQKTLTYTKLFDLLNN